jgi:hypothetical protein
MLAVTEMGQKSRKRIRSHHGDSHLHCGNHFSLRFGKRSFRAHACGCSMSDARG